MGMFEWVDPARNAFVRILRDAPISKLADEGLPSQNKLREALMSMPKFDRNAKIEDESAFWNPGGMFGTFAGVNAKTANKAMLEVAQKMDKAGADRGAIWNETGWFKGPDSKWRFEIDDSKSKIIPKELKRNMFGNRETELAFPLDQVLKHDDLYSAYPKARNINAEFAYGNMPEQGDLRIFDNRLFAQGFSKDSLKSSALHELQHGVQATEGFAIGGNSNKKSFENYLRLAGEAEARATQARMNMTPAERKAKPPWESYDIPWDQLIIR